MQKKTNTMSVGTAAGLAASLTAIAAAGYFVFGPQAKKNKKAIKSWTLKMKGEVLEKIEKLKEVTPELYHKAIDDVSAKYGKMKELSAPEVALLAADLKKHWKAISRDLSPTKAKKSVKKAAKKAAKAVKKAVK